MLTNKFPKPNIIAVQQMKNIRYFDTNYLLINSCKAKIILLYPSSILSILSTDDSIGHLPSFVLFIMKGTIFSV